MTSERAQAYGRVIRLLADKGPSKLQPAEDELVRAAADSLLFGEADDPAAAEARAEAEILARHLLESGRWEESEVSSLLDALAGCGPAPAVLR